MSEFQYTLEQQIWLRALESGEYPQGFRQLCVRALGGGDSYCCLGVACEVLKIDKHLGDKYCYYCTGTEYHASTLPEKARVSLGLRSSDGTSYKPFEINGKRYFSLAEANDEGCTHQEIAAAIRANPANFFLGGV